MINIDDVAYDDFANCINLWKFETNKDNPNIFLIGRFHGDEPEGEYILEKLIDKLKNNNFDSAYNIYIIPSLNPSGKKLFTRGNANKIDLNRNYPTKNFSPDSVNPHTKNLSAGTPASEKETEAMIAWVEKYNPVRIISIHSDLHLVDYDGPARQLAEQMSLDCGYKLVDNIGYPTNGSFGTWAGIEKQIPVITLETWKAKTKEDFEKIYAETEKAILNFCELA